MELSTTTDDYVESDDRVDKWLHHLCHTYLIVRRHPYSGIYRVVIDGMLWLDCLKSKCYPWERRKPEGRYTNDSSEGSSPPNSSPTGSEGSQTPEYKSILLHRSPMHSTSTPPRHHFPYHFKRHPSWDPREFLCLPEALVEFVRLHAAPALAAPALAAPALAAPTLATPLDGCHRVRQK